MIDDLPKWIKLTLRLICPKEILEEIEGDLLQHYNRDVSRIGTARSNLALILRTIRFIRPGIILRNKFSIERTALSMIGNYLVVAYRQMLRNKIFALANVCGLAVGMSAFFVILQYVNFETTFEDFHPNQDRVFRVGLERHDKNKFSTSSAKHFYGLRRLIIDEINQVDAVTGFYKTPANTGVLFHYNGKMFNETGGELNTDTSFFKVFPGLLLKGDPGTVLKDPHNIVVSESMARKIFGNDEPIGKHLMMPSDNNDLMNFVVTGVFRDIPANSHFHANFVVPLEQNYIVNPDQEWKSAFIYTYIQLKDSKDESAVIKRVNSLIKKSEQTYPETKGTTTFFQSLSSIHLSSSFGDEIEPSGSKTLIASVSTVGILILIIAWINYVNLETARFTSRTKEVGVRRIIGSGKGDLALQFLVEYGLMSGVALMLSVALLVVIRPYLGTFTGIPLDTFEWPSTTLTTISLGLFGIGSLIAGAYPGFMIIRINLMASLKGKITGGRKGHTARSLMTSVQFATSFILITFVLVVGEQLDFMKLANKQFSTAQVIAIRNPTAYSSEDVLIKHKEYQALTNELIKNSGISMLTSSSALPGSEIGFTYVNLLKRNANDPFDPTRYKTLFVDDHYIPFYGVELLAGKNFAPPSPSDQWIDPWIDPDWHSIILNEKAVYALGYNSPDEAVNQIVEFQNFENYFEKVKIIGVIKDYHHEAVKKEVFPMILTPNYGSFQQVYFSIRLDPGVDLEEKLKVVNRAWIKVFPERPFDYFFLDEHYDQQYKSERIFNRIFSAFSGIAVFIACLGTFGMTLFEANSRGKEISIRKVLGASIAGIVSLLSRDQFKAIGLSVIISVPVIYFSIDRWLSSYPVRINFSFLTLTTSFLIVLSTVLVTSFFHTIRAAAINPVVHLKGE